jgi:hypothetical protein
MTQAELEERVNALREKTDGLDLLHARLRRIIAEAEARVREDDRRHRSYAKWSRLASSASLVTSIMVLAFLAWTLSQPGCW